MKQYHKGSARILNFLLKSSKDEYITPTLARVSIIRTDEDFSGDRVVVEDAVAGISGHYVYYMINQANITDVVGNYKVRFKVTVGSEIFKFFVDIEIIEDPVQTELDLG